MVWVYSIIGIISALLSLIALSTIYERRKTKRELREVKNDDIEQLVQECIRIFREKLGLELDLNDIEGSTATLDENINTSALREAFAQKGFDWYFVKLVGAFFGELIQRHRHAGWQQEEDGSLSIWIKDGQDEKTIRPFEMVFEQAFTKKGGVFTSFFTNVFTPEDSVESEAFDTDAQIDSYNTESVSTATDAQKPADVEILNLKKQVESGANWFFLIAGLSLVNSVLILINVEWGFFFGLGITQIIDSIAVEFGEKAGYLARIVAFSLDVIAASVFVLFGFLSKKNRSWAFVTGMILYALDAMLFLIVKDFFNVAFHAFALYCIFNGFKASRTLRANLEDRSLIPGTSLKPMAVSPDAKLDQDGPTREVVWPVVITIISFIYAIFYTIVNVRGLSNPWRLAACLSLFGGVLGVGLKKKGGVTLLLIGSSLIILRMAYHIALTLTTMEEPPSIPIIVTIAVLALVFGTWPAFLIIWFLRKPIRTFVKNKWT